MTTNFCFNEKYTIIAINIYFKLLNLIIMNIKSFLSWLLVGLIGVAIVFGALEIQTDIKNALIYIQKIFVTSDWTSNGEKRVVIDGSDGSILMSWSLNVKGDVILKEKVIDGYEIADNAVNDRVLADDAVDTAAIQDGSITNEKISNSAITSDKILDETITENDLSENSVWASELKESDYYEMKWIKLTNWIDIYWSRIRGFMRDTCNGDISGKYTCSVDEERSCIDTYVYFLWWWPRYYYRNVTCRKDNIINGDLKIYWRLNMNNTRIMNLANPIDDYDAVNKRYVDNKCNRSYWPYEEEDKDSYPWEAWIKEIEKTFKSSYWVKVCINADDAYIDWVRYYYNNVLVHTDNTDRGGKDEDGGWKTVCSSYYWNSVKINKIEIRGWDAGGPGSFNLIIQYKPFVCISP